jgi:hypothetical protein
MNVSLLEKWVSCIMKADLEDLLDMYKPEALLFATFDQTPLDTPSLIREYFTNFLSREEVGVELAPQTITHIQLGEGTSSSTGLYTFFFKENDQLIRHKARFTFIFNEENSGSILHHHSSVIPS